VDCNYIMINGVSINTNQIAVFQPATLGKGSEAKFLIQVFNKDHVMKYSFPFENLTMFMDKYKQICEFLGTWNQLEFHQLENALLDRVTVKKESPSKG
jgi:hypothetical protein